MNIMNLRRKKTRLEMVIDSISEEMLKLEPDSDEYAKMADNLEKLSKAKSYEKQRGVSPDTIAIIAGNLLGIGLILGYEKANIITTKAISFVLRGRA